MWTLFSRSPFSLYSFQLVWIALTATAIVVLAAPAAAQQRPGAHVDGQVAAAIKRGGSATVRVIVRVTPERRGALKQTAEKQGHVVKREHALISALTIELPERALKALTREEGVLSISFDARVSTSGAGGQDLRPQQESLSFSEF